MVCTSGDLGQVQVALIKNYFRNIITNLYFALLIENNSAKRDLSLGYYSGQVKSGGHLGNWGLRVSSCQRQRHRACNGVFTLTETDSLPETNTKNM